MDVEGLATSIQALPVVAVTSRWPVTIQLLNSKRMACVGCAFAPYCSLADVASFYGMAPEAFALEVARAIAGQDPDHDQAAEI